MVVMNSKSAATEPGVGWLGEVAFLSSKVNWREGKVISSKWPPGWLGFRPVVNTSNELYGIMRKGFDKYNMEAYERQALTLALIGNTHYPAVTFAHW